MSIRAVICDLYNTLLEVGPPPDNAAVLWDDLCRRLGTLPAPLTLSDFDAGCREAVRRAHAEAKLRGIAVPEVFWPHIAVAACPALGSWPERELDAFLDQHAQLQRSIRLMPGAAEALTALDQRGVWLGFCSNCQPYTLHELRRAFKGTSLALERFHPDLRFFSFEAGFSKPDPGAFRQLEQALATLGISPAEALMVGDRLDNDILPAKARGWRTWHLAPAPAEKPGGSWGGMEWWSRGVME